MRDSSLQHWSKDDWAVLFSSQGPTIREITECLGLSCATERGGAVRFSKRELRNLSNGVQKVSKDLPRDLHALLESASTPNTIDKELDELLTTHGPVLWGKNADRKRLLLAPGNSTTYRKDLFYEVPVDREILKTHLHRWIYKTAYKQNEPRKLPRLSAAGDRSTSSTVASTAETIAIYNTVTTRPGMAQRNDLGKRKADTNIANLYTEGDSTITTGPAEKRPCLNATMSAQAFSQEPLPPSRHGSENVAHTPTPNGTHLSPRLTRTLSASPSGTATTLTNPPFRSRLNGAPSPANHRASTFTAVNQLPRSDSFASDSCSDSSSIRSVQAASSTTGSDGPLPEVSLSPVTPNESSSHERLRPFSSSTQHQSGLGRKTGTDTSYIQTRLAPQATTTYPTEVFTTSAVPMATASLQNHAPQSATAVRTNNATRVLPLSPDGVPSLHHTIGRTIDHHSSSERDALPAPREVTILQCELLQLLLGYLFPRDGYEVEEADLLCSLEEIWAEHEQQFKLAFHRVFASYREALFAWISERRITTQLRLMIESEPSAETLETVDRVLAVNDLRILRLKWRTINALDGDQAISPEDLLCKAFAAMTRTDGTEPLFKRGLEKLEETAISAVRYEDLTISIHA